MELFCPITFTPLNEIIHPVAIRETPDIIFEFTALACWIRKTHTNPMTRSPVLWSDIILLGPGTKNLLEHEMSEDFKETPAPNFLSIYVNYADCFERNFVVQPNGTLCCDRETRAKVPAWYNSQLDFIKLFTSFAPPRIVLREPQQGEIQVTNNNKMEMIRAYCFAFLAYHKVCDTLGRPVSPNYNPGLIVDDTGNTICFFRRQPNLFCIFDRSLRLWQSSVLKGRDVLQIFSLSGGSGENPRGRDFFIILVWPDCCWVSKCN